ncbi:helix-turn-helix domain-containing protein [Streptomyces sp. NPDC091280]|uniref:helix-turn-helix domain-containing protein n=1 Tax=Streptomyces sp. NPDC091280 TaxID=3365984 RepID=UPI00381CC52B
MSAEPFGQALKRWRGSLSIRDAAALAKIGKSYVSRLERGDAHPSPDVAASLDQALGAGGELIAAAEVNPRANTLDRADTLQRGLHEVLAAGPMTTATVEEWEFTALRHGRATRFRPEAQLLVDLLDDFQDLRTLLAQRHAPNSRNRLHVVAAQMSGLLALTLLKLGDDRSRAWWRTGRAAAAAAEDPPTLSWIYAHEAYQQYYSGDVHGAIDLAVRAQQLARGLPSVGPALAAPLEARAHGLLGATEEAKAALKTARSVLSRLPEDQQIGSAFGYSASQLHFHSGNALTHLGEVEQAREELAQAVELYPADDLTDRALISLDEAMCLAVTGEPAAAAVEARRALVALPSQHRSALILSRAREIAARVPEAQATAEIRSLHEVLALPERNKSEG